MEAATPLNQEMTMKGNGFIPSRHIRVVGMGGTLRKHSSSLLALDRALSAAERVGASVELLNLRELDLPIYRPGKPIDAYGANVARFIREVQQADAMLWSTAAYHGTLAGVTKNAIDFLQFLSSGDKPYLQDKAIGLIATAGGDMAAVNATNAMVNAVHSLRGTVLPLIVAIPRTKTVIRADEAFIDGKWTQRLDELGNLAVATARALRLEEASIGF